MRFPKWQTILLVIVLGSPVLATIGCSGPNTATGTPAATEDDSAENGSTVSATGEVIPAEWATLSFPVSGPAAEILVKAGTQVEKGDVLARLDANDLEMSLASAKAALQVTQANLDLAKAGPREQEVDRAKQQLAAANARVSVAVAQREQAKKGPSQTEVIKAQSERDQAANSQQNAQEGYDDLIKFAQNWTGWDDLEPGDRTPLDGEQNARYSLELANIRLAAAQAALDKLLAGPDPDDLKVADARVWAAAAQRDSAQAYLNLVMAGAAPADINISKAQVESAQAAVDAVQIALDQTQLVAPFDGTISKIDIHIGETVSPGQSAITIANLDRLQVETTDLNEIDVARINVEDTASVTFDALPGVMVSGKVAKIAPKSSPGAGVNYKVTIQLDELPDALRWGMTAFVDINIEQGN